MLKGKSDKMAFFLLLQGLQRRATPHPSELKEMKKGIEERRNEAYTSRQDEDQSLDPQVHNVRNMVTTKLKNNNKKYTNSISFLAAQLQYYKQLNSKFALILPDWLLLWYMLI